nr:glycoside hydrolase family 38 C-terminal domain-containing protein [Candidatus Sigynarchaeota archaeon]
MSFPFGIFKAPERSKKGRYSGAQRDPAAEMAYDEGDSDAPYKNHVGMADDPKAIEKFEQCWNDRITIHRDLYEKDGPLQLYALAQSHIDIAWLWRLYQTVNKARITQGKAAFHVLKFPEFKFTFSQPVMLEWLEATFPDVFEHVQKAVKTGRFDIQGGDYVESDAKMPSGEAFCRQRLYGQRYYLEKFGKQAEVGWLPDSFGYSSNIPQFLVKSGCKYFYTQKISGNWPPEAFPFVHFRWRSPDGSEVITYSNNFQFRPITRWGSFGRYRRILKPGAVLECNYSHPDPASDPALGPVYPVVGIVFGTGDGGHGPTCEEVHRMRHYVQTGKVKGFVTAKEYFAMYEKVRDQLPVWNGAGLFYHLHTGTHTTQCLVKRMNRYFEWMFTGLEALLSANNFVEGRSSTGFHLRLNRAWKKALLLQFHDILPGSSIPEVYDDCYDIWTENQQEVRELQSQLPGFDGEIPVAIDASTSVVLANPSACKGRVLAEIPLPEKLTRPGNIALVNAAGKVAPCQVLPPDDLNEPLIDRPSRVVACIDAEPWSIVGWKVRGIAPAQPKCSIDESADAIIMNTPFARVVIKSGMIESYHDKAIDKEIFSKPARIGVFRDWFSIERAWNIGAGYKECPLEPEEFTFVQARVIERGPVRYTVEIEHVIPESSSRFKQRVQLYAELPGLYIELIIDWRQQEAIAKHYFSMSTNPVHAVVEGPFTTELITADPDRRSHLEKQQWESVWQTWLAMPSPDDTWGVAVMNDCKYGFDVDKDTVGITLIRGPDYPGASGYAAEERKGRTDNDPPTHTDQGKHLVRYALWPYAGPWSAAGLQKRAHQYNAPIISKFRRGPFTTPLTIGTCLTATPGNLEIVAMKKAEDDPRSSKKLIVRIVETGRLKTKGTTRFSRDLPIIDVKLVDLVEHDWPAKAMEVKKNGDIVESFTVEWAPHEILSFLLTRK